MEMFDSAMNRKLFVIKELKKAMEFYSELGFQYLPVSEHDIHELKASDESPLERCKAGTAEVVEKDQAAHSAEDSLLDLKNSQIGNCQRCKLAGGRKNIVFGEGNPDASLMFIGEGPGREEDNQGRPFVGDAGKLLNNLIVKLGMKREDVYIANIVKCRPPSNRNPERDEISKCRTFVEKQIEIVRPKVIVCLGKISAQSILDFTMPISRMRGRFYSYNNVPVMPTFHPAYLLRNPKDKWLTWDDMQKVINKIAEQCN